MNLRFGHFYLKVTIKTLLVVAFFLRGISVVCFLFLNAAETPVLQYVTSCGPVGSWLHLSILSLTNVLV